MVSNSYSQVHQWHQFHNMFKLLQVKMKVFDKAVEECMKMKMRKHRGCGLDVTGQGVGSGTTTGVRVSPWNLGGIRSLYVKSANLDTAAMQHYTYVLKPSIFHNHSLIDIHKPYSYPQSHLIASFHSHLSQPWFMAVVAKISLNHHQCDCSSLAILPSSSLVGPLQHVCSAFLEIPKVIQPTKLD